MIDFSRSRLWQQEKSKCRGTTAEENLCRSSCMLITPWQSDEWQHAEDIFYFVYKYEWQTNSTKCTLRFVMTFKRSPESHEQKE